MASHAQLSKEFEWLRKAQPWVRTSSLSPDISPALLASSGSAQGLTAPLTSISHVVTQFYISSPHKAPVDVNILSGMGFSL